MESIFDKEDITLHLKLDNVVDNRRPTLKECSDICALNVAQKKKQNHVAQRPGATQM